jgi:hypothetical protein
MRLIIGDGMKLAGVGAAVGIATAVLGGRLLRFPLYDVHIR